MSNLILLLKTNLINETGINKIKYEEPKEKNKLLALGLLIGISIVILIVYLFKGCLAISDFLIKINQMELLLIMGVVGGVIFVLFTSMYKASSYLFSSRDFEMLISLPIKESTIFASKILMLLFTNYLFSAPMVLIPIIVYIIKVEISVVGIVNLIVLFLSLPLIPMIIAMFVSFIIGGLSSKIRHKNFGMILGSIVLLLAYMIGLTQIESIGSYIMNNSSSIIEGINKIYPLANYFVDGIVNNDIKSVVIFILISLLLFIAFIVAFSKGYKNINAKMNENYRVKNYKLTTLKTNKPIKALLNKEIKRYFSSYIYVLNTSIGVILLLVGSIGISVFGMEKIDYLLGLNIDMNMLKPQVIIMILFMVGVTCTTYCSISLEGKNLWILKSSPIKELDIFKSKIIMNLLINLPISIIGFLLIGFSLKFDIKFITIMLVAIVSMSIFTSLLGFVANLSFPNLDWKNEVAVVKRSIASLVAILGSIAYIGLFALLFKYFNILEIDLYLGIATVITIIIDIILWSIIRTKGIKMFKAL